MTKFGSNSNGAIWWPNLQPIQVVPLKSILNYSSWKIYSKYGVNTLGPLCLWQCFLMWFSNKYWNLWMEFCWEFPEARVKPLDKPPVFQISAWPSRCETTVSSSQWDTVSHRHVGMQAGSGHSQEQAGSVTARDDDQGEYFFCFSQLLVTLVTDSCIFTPTPQTNTHSIRVNCSWVAPVLIRV